MVTARKKRRKKPRRPGRHSRGLFLGLAARRALKAVVFLAVVGWGGYAFFAFARDDYPVKEVRVQGARVLDPEYVVDVSGITVSDNLLVLDVQAVQERVEALPFVKSCLVKRIYPDNVLITLEEREAAAILMVHNRMFEIDAECVALREVFSGETQAGPLITVMPDLGSVDAGQHIDSPPLAAALSVWAAYARSAMVEDVTLSEIVVRGENDIRMYFDELPYEIRWGRKDFEKQAQRLDALWRELDKSLGCSEYLDLRFGRDVVCL